MCTLFSGRHVGAPWKKIRLSCSYTPVFFCVEILRRDIMGLLVLIVTRSEALGFVELVLLC